MKLAQFPESILKKFYQKYSSLYQESITTYSDMVENLIESNTQLTSAVQNYISLHDEYEQLWHYASFEQVEERAIMVEKAYESLKEVYNNVSI